MKNWNNPFHRVTYSPWPIIMAVFVANTGMGMVLYLNFGMLLYFLFSLTGCLTMLYKWLNDVMIESTYLGYHTKMVQLMHEFAFKLFIASEASLFLCFLVSFVWLSMLPTTEMGCSWPPMGVETMKWKGLPLLNTALLVGSGSFLTAGHLEVSAGSSMKSLQGMFMCMLMGLFFTLIQFYEWKVTSFTFNCSVYGNCFFLVTGFHGLHVMMGTMFLIVQYMSIILYHMTTNHHVGLKCAVWYWHFVDMVWMLVFLMIYVWGS